MSEKTMWVMWVMWELRGRVWAGSAARACIFMYSSTRSWSSASFCRFRRSTFCSDSTSFERLALRASLASCAAIFSCLSFT